jgi:DNA-binding transcriptional regulator LsrR (DeoR family)
VSAIGGSPQIGVGVNPGDACRRLAERFGGQAEVLYAPAYAETEQDRATFLEHADVRETLEHARAAGIAVVGIGDARDDSAVVQMGCFSTADMARMRTAGAVGDILGFFFNIEGVEVTGGVGARVVGLSAADLRGIPRVLAVSSEPDKTAAVLGALRTGIVDVLVTSLGSARQVLASAGEPPDARDGGLAARKRRGRGTRSGRL